MTVNYSTINVPSNGRLVEMVELGVTHWPIAVTTALLMIAAYAIQSFLKEDQLAKLPRIGSDDLRTRWLHFLGEGSWDMYLEGYKKVRENIHHCLHATCLCSRALYGCSGKIVRGRSPTGKRGTESSCRIPCCPNWPSTRMRS